jgi:hypothetical protein
MKKYPFVELTIKNYKPTIAFHPEDGLVRNLTLEETDLIPIILDIAEALALVVENTDEIAKVDELINLVREADEFTFDIKEPDIDLEDSEFSLEKVIKTYFEKLQKSKPFHSNINNLASDVQDELDKYHNIDILSNILDTIYKILIAKTLVAAANLGIGDIYLNDEHKNARLQELMAKELEKLGVELYIEDNN